MHSIASTNTPQQENYFNIQFKRYETFTKKNRNWSAVLQSDRSRNMCFALCTRAVFTDEFSFEREGPKHILARHFQILAPLAPSWIRHCPWEACDAHGRPVVPLTSLGGPWQARGASHWCP